MGNCTSADTDDLRRAKRRGPEAALRPSQREGKVIPPPPGSDFYATGPIIKPPPPPPP